MLNWLKRKTEELEAKTEDSKIGYSFQGESVYDSDDGEYGRGIAYPFLFICIEKDMAAAKSQVEAEMCSHGWSGVKFLSSKKITTSKKENVFIVYAETNI